MEHRQQHREEQHRETSPLLPAGARPTGARRRKRLRGAVWAVGGMVAAAGVVELALQRGASTEGALNVELSNLKAPPPTTAPPNIVLLLVDDLGYNDVGWAGDDFSDLTPTLSALRDSGVELTQYYSQQLCTPARGALLSGRYPFRTGTQSEVVQPEERWGLPTEYSLLPEYLTQLGYDTHAVGKWHLGHSTIEQLPQSRGFSDFYGMVSDQTHYYDHTNPTNGHLDFMSSTAAGGGVGAAFTCVADKDGQYSTALHTDRALDIMERWSKQQQLDSGAAPPLFLYMAYQSPHYPLEPDESLDYSPVGEQLGAIADPSRRNAAKLVYGLDLEIKRLLEGLDSAGILDNTVLVFASDNGACPSHGLSNYPLRGTKHYTFEGGSRVRSLLSSSRLPEAVRGGLYTGLFHVTDWLPTLMDAVQPGWSAAAEYGGALELDGVSHWDALMSGDLNSSVRSEVVYNIQSILAPDATHGGVARGLVPRGAIRQGDWKLVLNEACQVWSDFGGRFSSDEYTSQCATATSSCGAPNDEQSGTWLFNLAEDPYETTDLLADQPTVAETLRRRLETLSTQQRPSEWQGSSATAGALAQLAWDEQGCMGPWDAQ